MWVHSADRRRMSFCLPGSDGRSLERAILALPDYGTPWWLGHSVCDTGHGENDCPFLGWQFYPQAPKSTVLQKLPKFRKPLLGTRGYIPERGILELVNGSGEKWGQSRFGFDFRIFSNWNNLYCYTINTKSSIGYLLSELLSWLHTLHKICRLQSNLC